MQIEDKTLVNVTDEDIANGTVIIPDYVEIIGDEAFKDCKLLEEIHIPDSVISIGENAFRGCKSLHLVTLSKNLEEIGYGAFYKCISLKEIIIPDSVTEIGSFAFSHCENLRTLILPKSLKIIPNCAFSWTQSLLNIEIPNNVIEIEANAFNGCKSLTKLFLSSNIVKMGDSFNFCDNLNLYLKTSLIKYITPERGIEHRISMSGAHSIIIDVYGKKFNGRSSNEFTNAQKYELKCKTDEILKNKGQSSKKFFNDNTDIERYFNAILGKLNDSSLNDYDYKTDLEEYINERLSKSMIVSTASNPILLSNNFNDKPVEEVYQTILNYIPSDTYSNIISVNQIIAQGNDLDIYPNYIAGQFLTLVLGLNKDDNYISKIVKSLDGITNLNDKKNFLKSLFFKFSNDKSEDLSLNIDVINELNAYAQRKKEELSKEIYLIEYLKKIIKSYNEKTQLQIQNLENSSNVCIESDDIYSKSDKKVYLDLMENKITDLQNSIEMMECLYQKVNILLEFKAYIYQHLNTVINKLIPYILSEISLNKGIIQSEESLQSLRFITDLLNNMIIDENSKKSNSNPNINRLQELSIEISQIIDEISNQTVIEKPKINNKK